MAKAIRRTVPVELGDDGTISINTDGFSFLGNYVRSANSQWMVAYGWGGDPVPVPDGEARGLALLFANGRQVARVDGLKRPAEAAVCDVGVFAINEWGRQGEFLGPDCCLMVFNAQGKRVFRAKAAASIEKPTLSADGRYLAYHTLAAPEEATNLEDEASLFVVDLANKTFLWQRDVPGLEQSGGLWPDGMAFEGPDSAPMLVVRAGDGKVYRYTLHP